MSLINLNFKEYPLLVRYIVATYWSVVTVMTTGYGDLHPVNTYEMIYAVFFLLFNSVFQSYITGIMTDLFVAATSRAKQFRESIYAASRFAKHNHLPPRLENQIVAHLSLRHQIDLAGPQFDALPKGIRSNIRHSLFNSLVHEVYLFNGVSNDTLFQLVSEMKAEDFAPRADIILQNDTPSDLYIVVHGAAELISRKDREEEVVEEYKTGDIFGEVGVLCYMKQLYTVRTRKLSQLLCLSRTSFLDIIEANAEDGIIILNNLLQHMKAKENQCMRQILADTERILSYGRRNMPLILCVAASRGDHVLLERLLVQGLNPNELDGSGLGALHIVAARGSLDCVRVLLKKDASVDIRDSEGNTPLWHAILSNDISMMDELIAGGATMTREDAGRYACLATERSDRNLLDQIKRCGGDLSSRSDTGTTALHIAVSNENDSIVRYLLVEGVGRDTSDARGQTARALANSLGNEIIKAMFRSEIIEPVPDEPEPIESHPVMIPHMRWPRVSDFQNSLAGIISAGWRKRNEGPQYPARVTVSCPERGNTDGYLVFLPGSFGELLDLGNRLFGFRPSYVRKENGGEIRDISVIRDEDKLIFSSGGSNDVTRTGDREIRRSEDDNNRRGDQNKLESRVLKSETEVKGKGLVSESSQTQSQLKSDTVPEYSSGQNRPGGSGSWADEVENLVSQQQTGSDLVTLQKPFFFCQQKTGSLDSKIEVKKNLISGESSQSSRQKVNPFGDAKPIDHKLEHRVKRFETQEEKNLKEVIQHLKNEHVQKSGEAHASTRDLILQRERELEQLSRQLDDNVRYNPKVFDRRASQGGGGRGFSGSREGQRPPSQHDGPRSGFHDQPPFRIGPFGDPHGPRFVDRPWSMQGGYEERRRGVDYNERLGSRENSNAWKRPVGEDRRAFQGGGGKGFWGSRDGDRPPSQHDGLRTGFHDQTPSRTGPFDDPRGPAYVDRPWSRQGACEEHRRGVDYNDHRPRSSGNSNAWKRPGGEERRSFQGRGFWWNRDADRSASRW